MHCGPLGAMPDAIGSALLELCDSSIFGGSDLTDSSFHPWLNLAVVTSKTRKTVVFSIGL